MLDTDFFLDMGKLQTLRSSFIGFHGESLFKTGTKSHGKKLSSHRPNPMTPPKKNITGITPIRTTSRGSGKFLSCISHRNCRKKENQENDTRFTNTSLNEYSIQYYTFLRHPKGRPDALLSYKKKTPNPKPNMPISYDNQTPCLKTPSSYSYAGIILRYRKKKKHEEKGDRPQNAGLCQRGRNCTGEGGLNYV